MTAAQRHHALMLADCREHRRRTMHKRAYHAAASADTPTEMPPVGGIPTPWATDARILRFEVPMGTRNCKGMNHDSTGYYADRVDADKGTGAEGKMIRPHH